MKKGILHSVKLTSLSVIGFLSVACQGEEDPIVPVNEQLPVVTLPIEETPEEINYILPDIDLSHWKVTLPIGNPTEVYPPEILTYGENEMLKPFMYNDSID